MLRRSWDAPSARNLASSESLSQCRAHKRRGATPSGPKRPRRTSRDGVACRYEAARQRPHRLRGGDSRLHRRPRNEAMAEARSGAESSAPPRNKRHKRPRWPPTKAFTTAFWPPGSAGPCWRGSRYVGLSALFSWLAWQLRGFLGPQRWVAASSSCRLCPPSLPCSVFGSPAEGVRRGLRLAARADDVGKSATFLARGTKSRQKRRLADR